MTSRSHAPARSESGRREGDLGWIVIRTKLTIRRHQFRVAVDRHPGRVALQTFVVIPALFLIGFIFFVGLASGMSSAANDSEATALLTTLLTLTAVAAFIGSSTTALQSLYLSNDMPFLLTLPIPLRVVFVEKFIAAMSGTIPAAIIGFVSLAAFGASRADHLAFVPAALLALILVIVLSTTISVFIVALVTRSIPARRARLILLCISLTIVALTGLLWNAITPSQQHLGMGGADQSIVRLGTSLNWSPTSWLAQAVADASSRHFASAARALTDSVVLTLVAAVTSYQVFARTFSRSVAATRAAQVSKSNYRAVRHLSALVESLPQDIGALIVKEWLTIFRDLKRLSGVIWPLGVVAIYGITASRSAESDGTDPFDFWQANAALALLPWGISLGLTIFSIGSEQRAVHLLRLMPIGPRRLFAGKMLAAAVPILFFSEVITLIVSIAAGGRLVDVVGMMALVAWATCGFVTIDTAASAFAPNFEADHIQRSTLLVGRAFGMVAGAAFAVATSAAVVRLIFFTAEPPSLVRGALTWEVASVHPLGIPLVVLGTGTAIFIAATTMRVGIDRLDDLIRNGP